MRVRALLALTAVLGALVVAGASLVAADGAAPVPDGLPELPSVADRVDGLYDDAGCLHTGVDDVDCSVRADEVDAALAGGETRHLEGFTGPRWADGGTGPVVLPATVERSRAGAFVATGLVRHWGEQVVAGVEVTARLLDAEGVVLDEVRASSPVHDVRPGEPVPFRVESTVAAEQVARIAWSASAGATGDPTARALGWSAYWERPTGGEPVDVYLWTDPAGDRPHLLFGSVANLGERALADPEVLVAWVGPDGHLGPLVRTPVVGPDGSALSDLAPSATGDVLVVAATAPVPGSELILWVQGR